MTTKAFAFRVEWKTQDGDQDGYSYAVFKHHLLTEINRRQYCSGDVPGVISVVPVGVDLCKLIDSQTDKVYTTNLYKHMLDFEINHTGENYVSKTKRCLNRVKVG